nr:unnamed protein product [Callosobruchus chinensis]
MHTWNFSFSPQNGRSSHIKN